MAKSEDSAVLLVVDDEPLNRDLLRRVLIFDYEVLEAPDAEAALEILERTRVDVLICDQLMPGKNGTELVREVRARWPTTVCVLLTGYDDDPAVLAARKDGFLFDVIPKPWLAPQLKGAVRDALKKLKNS